MGTDARIRVPSPRCFEWGTARSVATSCRGLRAPSVSSVSSVVRHCPSCLAVERRGTSLSVG